MAGNFVHTRDDGTRMTPHRYRDGKYQVGTVKGRHQGNERRVDEQGLREAIGRGEKVRVSGPDGARPSLVNTDIGR